MGRVWTTPACQGIWKDLHRLGARTGVQKGKQPQKGQGPARGSHSQDTVTEP